MTLLVKITKVPDKFLISMVDLVETETKSKVSMTVRLIDNIPCLRVPSHEQTQTGLSFRSLGNSFRSTVKALAALT